MSTPAPGLADDAVARLVASVAGLSGRALNIATIRPIPRPEGKSYVADATLAVLVDGARPGDDMVILVSPAAFPEVVAEAVAKIGDVAGRVSDGTMARALRPLAEGYSDGLSFAAFPRLKPLSEGRISGRIEARLVAPAARAWLTDLARDSRRKAGDGEREALFVRPLQAVTEDVDLPGEMRQAAEAAMARLGEADLFSIVEHGDFWAGNLLFPRGTPGVISAARGDFRVIDWRGARVDGYPFADLARLSLSIRRPGAKATGRAFDIYARDLAIARQDVGLYALAAVGRGGMELDHFPRPRYLALTRRLFDVFRIHGYLR